MGVVHPDFEDGWPLVAEQRDRLGGLVQLVDAAAAVLVPEEELLVVAQAEGVIQLVTLVDNLLNEGRRATLVPDAAFSEKLHVFSNKHQQLHSCYSYWSQR